MRALTVVSFLISVVIVGTLRAQEVDYTQYYLNLATVNSGFTGIEDYLDLKMSVRQGWGNFNVKNNNFYISAFGTIKNSNLSPLKNSLFHLSNPAYYNKILSNKDLRRKQGIGGVVSSMDIGLYKSVSMKVNYAYHLPISKKLNWSLGAKAGYTNQRIDFSGYTVRDEINDAFYQTLIHANQGSENLVVADFGSVLYSSSSYLAISTNNLVRKQVGGFNLLSNDQPVVYTVQAATNLKVGSNFFVNPGFKLRTSYGGDLSWAINSRFRYKDLFYIGASYEKELKVSTLLGLFINGTYAIHYSYDQYLAPLNSFNVNVHEVVIGISLFNRYGLKPKFW